jgi:hypothetical protein
MANGNKVVVYIISSLFLHCIVTISSSYSVGEDFTGSQMVVNELGSDPDSSDIVTLETLATHIKLKNKN